MTAPIVCVTCLCEDPEADAVAALIAGGVPVMVACRQVWGAS